MLEKMSERGFWREKRMERERERERLKSKKRVPCEKPRLEKRKELNFSCLHFQPTK